MVITWSKHSQADLKNFLDNVYEGNDKSANNYIISLMNYINLLKNNPYLGKLDQESKIKSIRQLIYRKHKIFYTVYDDYILILTVVHSSRNIDNYFKDFLSNNF